MQNIGVPISKFGTQLTCSMASAIKVLLPISYTCCIYPQAKRSLPWNAYYNSHAGTLSRCSGEVTAGVVFTQAPRAGSDSS